MKTGSAVFLIFCFLLLSGCILRLSQVGPGKTVDLSENEALIFGKILFIENGEEEIPYSTWTQRPFPTLFRIESEKYYIGPEVEKDGAFYWKIPRGTFIMSKIEYAYIVLPQVAFKVPSDADAVYLGSLVIDAEIEKSVVFGRYIKKINSITVADEFDKAKETLLSRNPGLTDRVEKSLMVFDRSIPVDEGLLRRELLGDIFLILTMPPSPLFWP